MWGPQYLNETSYLRVYLTQLRKKLETVPSRPRYLITEPGMGYRFQSWRSAQAVLVQPFGAEADAQTTMRALIEAATQAIAANPVLGHDSARRQPPDFPVRTSGSNEPRTTEYAHPSGAAGTAARRPT